MLEHEKESAEEVRRQFETEYERLFMAVNRTKCGNCRTESNLHLHHVVPISLGGTNNIENLSILCKDCHSKAHKGSVFVDGLKSVNDRLTATNLVKWRLEDRLTCAEIGEMTGAHFSTVAKYCRKFGIKDVRNSSDTVKYSIDLIEEYFKEMVPGECVKRHDIYSSIGIDRKTFYRQEKTERFKNALINNRIKNDEMFFTKER